MIAEKSGFEVTLEKRQGTPPPRGSRDSQGRMEINLAYQRIAQAFEGSPHRPLRVGLHPGPDGVGPVIRLQFISPEVGARYRELMDRLEAEIGFCLKVSPGADQNGILEEARRLVAPLGRIRRGPKFMARERAVAIELEVHPPGVEALKAVFRERTGYELRLACQRSGRG